MIENISLNHATRKGLKGSLKDVCFMKPNNELEISNPTVKKWLERSAKHNQTIAQAKVLASSY